MATAALSCHAAAVAGQRLRPLLLAGLMALAGCGGQPFDYTPIDEIPPGPGLLTGEDGAFVISIGGGPEPDTVKEADEAGDISIGDGPEADTTEKADEAGSNGPD